MSGLNNYLQIAFLLLISTTIVHSHSHDLSLRRKRRNLKNSSNIDGCKDTKSKFPLTVIFPTGEFDCEWVGKNPTERCFMDETKIQCPETCNLCSSVPNVSYESDEYPFCEDSKKGEGVTVGSEHVTCKLVRKKRKKNAFLCNFPSVKSLCPRTCGNCECTNNEKDFVITMKSFHQGRTRNCAWVGRYPNPRCNISDAVENCPEICGQCPSSSVTTTPTITSYPTSTPTISNHPTPQSSTHPSAVPSLLNTEPTCEDNTTRFEITSKPVQGGDKKSCTWARAKKWFRCEIEEVKENCPVTCGACCEDMKGKILFLNPYGKTVLKTCEWIGRKDTFWRCKRYLGASEYCGKTCQSCSEGGLAIQPSTPPTVSLMPTASNAPSPEPSVERSPSPSANASSRPSSKPSVTPTAKRTGLPTKRPTSSPLRHPTRSPTKHPSTSPSLNGSHQPSTSMNPTSVPSQSPGPSTFPSSSPTECVDEPNWFTYTAEGYLNGLTCTQIADLPTQWCPYFEVYNGKSPYEACCVCGGGSHLPIAPSQSPSQAPTVSPTISSQPSISSSDVPSAAPTSCVDEPLWIFDASKGWDCSKMTPSFCGDLHIVNGKSSNQACCICGGGSHVPIPPSESPSIGPTVG